MKERTLDSYLVELNSDSPTPGGGSAAAYVASLATSLVNMALKVSIKRKSFLNYSQEVQAMIHDKIAYFDAKVISLKGYMQQDEEAFLSYLQAMRLGQNIHPYQEACLQVPMLLAREVLVLMDDFNAMSPYIVKSIVGDLEMGLILATAVLKGCVVNIKINLQGLNNQALLAESLALIQKIEQVTKE